MNRILAVLAVAIGVADIVGTVAAGCLNHRNPRATDGFCDEINV